MTNFTAALIGVSSLLIATVTYAAPRCPDQQMSESGPFQGRICKYGDWQVSDAYTGRYSNYRNRY